MPAIHLFRLAFCLVCLYCVGHSAS